jgi:hypothetical protein
MKIVDAPGWSNVEAWFDGKVSLHDAEIESVDLRRMPIPSVIRVHVWRTLQEIDQAGHFATDRHATLSLLLDGILQSDFGDWNEQNVLFDMTIDKGEDGYRITLDTSYGFNATILAKGLRFEIEPR